MGLAIYLGTLVLAVALPWLADPEVRRVLRRRRRMADTLLGLAAFERAGGQVQSVDRIAAVIRRGSRSFWVQIVLPFPSLAVWLAFDPSFVWVGSLVAAATCISTEVRGASTSEPTNAVGLAEPPTALLRRFRIGALCVKGGLLAAASAAAFYAVTASGPWAPVRALLLSVASVLVFKHAHLVLTMTERLVRRSSPVDFDALPGGRPGALVLRSFSADNVRLFDGLAHGGPTRSYLPGRRRFEELVTSMLTRTGRAVTVGDPDERLPLLGAARTYRDHDDWQEAVIATAEASAAVVVFAGLTESLAWELGQLRDRELLATTLVLFPPGPDNTTAAQYERVCARLAGTGARLPEELAGCLVGLTIAPDGSLLHYVARGRASSAVAAAVGRFMWSREGAATAPEQFVMPQGRADAMVPVHEALVALEHGKPDLARRRMAGATLLPRESLAVHTWAVACLDGRADAAARLVAADAGSDAPLLAEHEAILRRLANLGAGPNVPRSLLLDLLASRTGEPDRPGAWDGATRVLTDSGYGNLPTPFSRSIDAFNTAEEDDEPARVVAAARVVLAAAQGTGEPTLVAGAEVLLGEILAAEDPVAAEELFIRAGRLRDAAKVIVHLRVPVWDPDEIVYRARTGLWSISVTKGDDIVNDALGGWLESHRPSGRQADPVRDRLW